MRLVICQRDLSLPPFALSTALVSNSVTIVTVELFIGGFLRDGGFLYRFNMADFCFAAAAFFFCMVVPFRMMHFFPYLSANNFWVFSLYVEYFSSYSSFDEVPILSCNIPWLISRPGVPPLVVLFFRQENSASQHFYNMWHNPSRV